MRAPGWIVRAPINRQPRRSAMVMTGSLLGILILSAAPALLRAQDSPPPPQSIPELEARILEILEETETPGLSIAIVTADSVLWAAGLGLAEVSTNRPATAETLFRIGSVSKAFAALAVMLAEDRGLLRLDDLVRDHLPNLEFDNRWAETDPIRIVHLLEHATGWDDIRFRDYALSDPAVTLQEGLDYTPGPRKSRWRPGSRVSYNNAGPATAARIVEVLEGRPFEEIAQDLLFDPIGMSTATLLRPTPPLDWAELYESDLSTPVPYHHISMAPSGAVNASANDMAAYLQFLINRGRVGDLQVVPAGTIERMELPESSLTARSGLQLGYGLNLATYLNSGVVWRGHGGGVTGGVTTMAYRPKTGVGFATMTNRSTAASGRIARLVRDYLTKDDPEPVPPPPAPLSALAREYEGWYRPDNPRVQWTYTFGRILEVAALEVTETGLRFGSAVSGPMSDLTPVSDRLFRTENDPLPILALVSDAENGREYAVEIAGGSTPTQLRRVSKAAVIGEWVFWAGWLAAGALVVLLGVVSLLRVAFRRERAKAYLGLTIWPLVLTGSCVMALGLIGVLEEAVAEVGVGPVTIFLCTLLIPVATVLGLVRAARMEPEAVRPWARRLVLVFCALSVGVCGYLAWAGLIGWRTWA